jgi:hypothetical protein
LPLHKNKSPDAKIRHRGFYFQIGGDGGIDYHPSGQCRASAVVSQARLNPLRGFNSHMLPTNQKASTKKTVEALSLVLVEMAVGLHSGPSLALPLRAPEAVQIVPYDLWNP